MHMHTAGAAAEGPAPAAMPTCMLSYSFDRSLRFRGLLERVCELGSARASEVGTKTEVGIDHWLHH